MWQVRIIKARGLRNADLVPLTGPAPSIGVVALLFQFCSFLRTLRLPVSALDREQASPMCTANAGTPRQW